MDYLARNTYNCYKLINPSLIRERYGYKVRVQSIPYDNKYGHKHDYFINHSFLPEHFLEPARIKTRFIVDGLEIIIFIKQAFVQMTKKEFPNEISINVLTSEEFKDFHSRFGQWSDGILGFSLNGHKKSIFVRENHLDELMIVIGHEIGHVMTNHLPNQHDEEAKAFAFSVGWANTIRNYDIANLGSSIRDEHDFRPARNGLHDVALGFVNLMLRKGSNALRIHDALIKKYISVFNKVY